MATFLRKYVLRPQDSTVYFYTDGHLQDPVRVNFTVYYIDGTAEVMMGVPEIEASKISTGVYYARFMVPEDAPYGNYRINFAYVQKAVDGDEIESAVSLFFEVDANVPATYSTVQSEYIRNLRNILRDNNPDAYYRFAPPVRTNIISGFTEEKGYLWQDDELLTFIDLALCTYNTTWAAGKHIYNLNSLPSQYKTYIIYLSASSSCFAESIRWISEEFSYDVEGHSLSIDRSSKFQAMAEALYEKSNEELEKIKGGIKLVRGVRSQYGISRGCQEFCAEVLTESGWKNWDKLNAKPEDPWLPKPKEKIRIFDLKTKEFKWEVPKRWYSYKINGERLHQLVSDKIDLTISIEHRVVNDKFKVQYAKTGENITIPYMDELDGEIKFTECEVKDIEYNGIVYCPEVSTGCFVARIDGCIFITGNSALGPRVQGSGLLSYLQAGRYK